MTITDNKQEFAKSEIEFDLIILVAAQVYSAEEAAQL